MQRLNFTSNYLKSYGHQSVVLLTSQLLFSSLIQSVDFDQSLGTAYYNFFALSENHPVQVRATKLHTCFKN